MDVPAPEHAGEPVILDGSNIAHVAGLDGLIDLETRFADAGWEVLVVVDASLRHRVDEDMLATCIDDGWVQVPKGTDADVHILGEADRLDCWVVSSDQFRDHDEPPRRRLDPGLLLAPLLTA